MLAGLPHLSVVIPAYNAGAFIGGAVTGLAEALEKRAVHFEIIVVDDGSTDDTGASVSALGLPTVTVERLEINAGKGAALKRGFKRARGTFIVCTDDDVPYGPDAVVACLDVLKGSADLVIGDRRLAASHNAVSVPLIRRAMSGLYFVVVSALVLRRLDLRDTQCGLKGMTRDFARLLVERSRVNRFCFDLEMLAIALDNNLRLARLPVVLTGAPGMSVRLVRESAVALGDVFRIAARRLIGHYRAVAALAGAAIAAL